MAAGAEVEWREATADEIPGGAKAVANAARKNGWDVRVGFARGPWVAGEEDDETDESELKVIQMVTVQGRRGNQRFRANWHCKLWTKDGADQKYVFAGAQIHPPVEGEVVASKAKKDRHPEHLGERTVGGLKNSKAMNAFIKGGGE